MIQRLQKYDLTHPQFITLASLVAHGQAVSMRELSEVTFQDAPSMTRIVDRLVKVGWVRRTRTQQDRRVVLVEATITGKGLIETIQCDQDQEDALGFSVMSDAELTKVEELLDHILIAHMKQMNKDSPVDMESVKQKLRGFARDPIGFIRIYKENKDGASS